jgi:hypothetical protein
MLETPQYSRLELDNSFILLFVKSEVVNVEGKAWQTFKDQLMSILQELFQRLKK